MTELTEESVVEWLDHHPDSDQAIQRVLQKHKMTKEQREKLLSWLKSHPDHPYVW